MLYRDSGKENGNYYLGFRFIAGAGSQSFFWWKAPVTEGKAANCWKWKQKHRTLRSSALNDLRHNPKP